MDVEITIDAMRYIDKYNSAIFFSGDSDFFPLINYLKNNGKKIYIISFRNNVSEELRTSGHGYCDVLDIEYIWGSNLKTRTKKIILRKKDGPKM